MFRGIVKATGYPLHLPVSPSLLLPCVTVCHHISTGPNNLGYTAPTKTISISYSISNNASHHTQENIRATRKRSQQLKSTDTRYYPQQSDKTYHTEHTPLNTKIMLMLTSPLLQNNTANVVVQQHVANLLKVDILMPETC